MKRKLRWFFLMFLFTAYTAVQGWGQAPLADWDMSDQTNYGANETSRDGQTYTWAGADNASWAVSTNWSPTRTAPANNDILQFNDGSTKTLTSVPAQTIGNLLVTGNTNVTLQTGSANTLTISNGTGVDLEVAAGSQLNVSGATALSIALSTGATASVSGAMTFAGGAHKLLAADASGITFNNGAVFTAGVDFDENAFGKINYNSVIFANGSTYIYKSGENPFGAATPNSVVVFQSGSLYLHKSSKFPSFSGRTYANFEFDYNGLSSPLGSKTISIDNLKITQGTFGFNVTATPTPGHSIKGNIEIMPGATLNFDPSSAGTVNLNGTSLQTISGGGTLSASSNSTIEINNSSGVRLNDSATFNHLTIVSGSSFDILPTGACKVVGTLTNNAVAAKLIIHSDATGTGSLIHSTANVPATVENYFTGASLSWHLLSSPVESQEISGDFTPGGSAYDFYLWYEQADTWVNFKFEQGQNPTFVDANGNNNFKPGRGYLTAYQTTNPIKSFTGNLNQGAITEVLTVSGSGLHKTYNLVGNPYPSTIDWKASSGWNWTNLEGNAGGGYDMHIYNDAVGNYGTYNSASLSDAGSNGVTRYITSCQGFMVKAASVGNIGMDNDIRVTNKQAFLKSTEELQDYLVLKVTNPEQSYADETIIEFHHENDEGGASKLFSFVTEAPSLYTTKYGKNYAINFYGRPNNERVIPLNFAAGVDGNYVITASSLETFAQETVIILEDMKVNITQELTDNSVYEFQANVNDDPARFKLHFGSVGIEEASPEDFTIYSAGSTIYLNSNKAQNAIVNVYNNLGQIVASKQLNVDGLTSFDANAQTGWYVVRLVADGNAVAKKVFIN